VGLTLQQVAARLGISLQRVSIIELRALAKLRKLIEAGEAPYLRELLGDDGLHDLRQNR
jgi:DNA-directed RNA polymerase sigma subunit (sigma70/sigma32)